MSKNGPQRVRISKDFDLDNKRLDGKTAAGLSIFTCETVHTEPKFCFATIIGMIEKIDKNKVLNSYFRCC